MSAERAAWRFRMSADQRRARHPDVCGGAHRAALPDVCGERRAGRSTAATSKGVPAPGKDYS
jgi:hypothetical protein